MTQILVVLGIVAAAVVWGLLQHRAGAAPDCHASSCGHDASCAGCDLAPSEPDHASS